MGGRNNLSTSLDVQESARFLGAKVAGIFPELADTPLTNSWTGRLGVTFDLMPHIGRINGMWYALGYSGHGVGIATLVGTELGRLVTGKLDRSPTRRSPTPPGSTTAGSRRPPLRCTLVPLPRPDRPLST